MSSVEQAGGGRGADERRLPPVIEAGVLSLALAVSGVIYLTSSLPSEPPIAPAVGLLAASALTVAVNAVVLARARGFAWRRFFLVYQWTLLGYGLVAGMLMFVFIHNDLPTRLLAMLVTTLAIGAVDIPMILSFSVARFAEDEDEAGS
jgi:hypothetical protein